MLYYLADSNHKDSAFLNYLYYDILVTQIIDYSDKHKSIDATTRNKPATLLRS